MLKPRFVATIGLGANLGDRLANLRAAVRALSCHGTILATSHVYETAPVGYEDQPAFLNAAVQLSTELTPENLLEDLLAIERSLGRNRQMELSQGPRTLDLDLLLYEDRILVTPQLTLPHPSLHQRRFVLAPLAEIAPDLRHPVLDVTVQNCWRRFPMQVQTASLLYGAWVCSVSTFRIYFALLPTHFFSTR